MRNNLASANERGRLSRAGGGSRAGGSRAGGSRGAGISSGIRSGGSRAGTLMVPGRGPTGADGNASLFDVVHGTRMSRAIGAGNKERFSAGRVSAAVAD